MHRFFFVCIALLLVAGGTNLVAPLFPLYQSRFGLNHGAVGLIASMYGVTLIPTMLLAGPLSDRWGRQTLLLPGLGFFILGDLAFAFAAGVSWLVVGRLLHGLAMGAFFSPSAALASDLADKDRPDLAALGAAVASMVGFGMGPFAAGVLIHANISPSTTPFVLHLVALLVAGSLLSSALQSPRSSALPHSMASLEPRDHPTGRWLAVLAGCGGWAVGGLLFIMLPAILRPLAGPNWSLLSGVALLGLMLAGAIAQIATRSWAPSISVAVGGLTETLGVCVLLFGLATDRLILVVPGILITGLGLASVHRGGIGLSIRATQPRRKGWAISLFLACAYFTANFPVIGFGVAADKVGMLAALAGYTIVFGSLLAGSGIYALLRRRSLP